MEQKHLVMSVLGNGFGVGERADSEEDLQDARLRWRHSRLISVYEGSVVRRSIHAIEFEERYVEQQTHQFFFLKMNGQETVFLSHGWRGDFDTLLKFMTYHAEDFKLPAQMSITEKLKQSAGLSRCVCPNYRCSNGGGAVIWRSLPSLHHRL